MIDFPDSKSSISRRSRGPGSGIVSGNEAEQGLIRSTVKGPDFLTGGNFGVESSILSLLLCTSTGIVMVVMAVKRGKIVPPIWKRTA